MCLQLRRLNTAWSCYHTSSSQVERLQEEDEAQLAAAVRDGAHALAADGSQGGVVGGGISGMGRAGEADMFDDEGAPLPLL
jgi:hypothetical protein